MSANKECLELWADYHRYCKWRLDKALLALREYVNRLRQEIPND